MKPLIELIANAQWLIDEISQDPGYQALVNKGFTPDVTLGDAQTALTLLALEVEPPALPVPHVHEIKLEVGHD